MCDKFSIQLFTLLHLHFDLRSTGEANAVLRLLFTSDLRLQRKEAYDKLAVLYKLSFSPSSFVYIQKVTYFRNMYYCDYIKMAALHQTVDDCVCTWYNVLETTLAFDGRCNINWVQISYIRIVLGQTHFQHCWSSSLPPHVYLLVVIKLAATL